MENLQNTNDEEYMHDYEGKRFQLNIKSYTNYFTVIIRQTTSLTNVYIDEVTFNDLKENNPKLVIFENESQLVECLHKGLEKNDINIVEKEQQCDLVIKVLIKESVEEVRMTIKKTNRSQSLILEEISNKVYSLKEENKTLKLDNTYIIIIYL